MVHDLDAEVRGIRRAVDLDRAALKHNLTRVVGVDAGDALDKGRLSRPIVADQGHHLSGTDLEIDVDQRLHGAKVSGYLFQLQDRAVVAINHSSRTVLGDRQAAATLVARSPTFWVPPTVLVGILERKAPSSGNGGRHGASPVPTRDAEAPLVVR